MRHGQCPAPRRAPSGMATAAATAAAMIFFLNMVGSSEPNRNTRLPGDGAGTNGIQRKAGGARALGVGAGVKVKDSVSEMVASAPQGAATASAAAAMPLPTLA